MLDLKIEDKLNSWMAHLNMRGSSEHESAVLAPHFLTASAIYQALLEASRRSDSWTRDAVTVSGLLDQAATHLRRAGIDRPDNPRDLLLIIERP